MDPWILAIKNGLLCTKIQTTPPRTSLTPESLDGWVPSGSILIWKVRYIILAILDLFGIVKWPFKGLERWPLGNQKVAAWITWYIFTSCIHTHTWSSTWMPTKRRLLFQCSSCWSHASCPACIVGLRVQDQYKPINGFHAMYFSVYIPTCKLT